LNIALARVSVMMFCLQKNLRRLYTLGAGHSTVEGIDHQILGFIM